MELDKDLDSKDHDFKKKKKIITIPKISGFERKTWIHKWIRYTISVDINLTDVLDNFKFVENL